MNMKCLVVLVCLIGCLRVEAASDVATQTFSLGVKGMRSLFGLKALPTAPLTLSTDASGAVKGSEPAQMIQPRGLQIRDLFPRDRAVIVAEASRSSLSSCGDIDLSCEALGSRRPVVLVKHGVSQGGHQLTGGIAAGVRSFDLLWKAELNTPDTRAERYSWDVVFTVMGP